MNENDNERLEPGQGGTDDLDLVKEIQELKKNTVSKEEYEKLKGQNKELIKQIISGGGQDMKAEDNPSIEELRKNIFENSDSKTNLEIADNIVKLYDARLKEGVNIFLPKGNKTQYTRADYEAADHYVETIRSMVTEAEGDPIVFDSLFKNALR